MPIKVNVSIELGRDLEHAKAELDTLFQYYDEPANEPMYALCQWAKQHYMIIGYKALGRILVQIANNQNN